MRSDQRTNSVEKQREYGGGIGKGLGIGNKAGQPKEERKRAGWGNKDSNGSKADLQVNGSNRPPMAGNAGPSGNKIPPSNARGNLAKRPSGMDVNQAK